MGTLPEGTRENASRRGAVALLILSFFFFFLLFNSSLPLSSSSYALISRSPAFAPAHALDVPSLKGYVNDYGGMISKPAQAKIESELKAFEQSDSTQVVILTVPSLQGEVLEDYSIKVVEQWKIGQKGKDNGVLLLVANQDRKIRIEVGRGLEGKLTDLTAGQIVDLVIKPRFKRGDFDGGFIAGVSAIVDASRGEFKAERPKAGKKGVSFSAFITFLILGGAFLLFMGGISKILGGLGGAFGLPALVNFALFPIGFLPMIILGIAGLGIGLVLPLIFSGRGPGGGWFFWGGGFGGGGGGGDSGGFGDGGFGGGGGGDFGGGGASGDW